MLGKRGYYTRKSASRTNKRRKLSSRSTGRSYRIRRDGNIRTGGLYRLRGGAPGTMGRGRAVELKFFEKAIVQGGTEGYAEIGWHNIANTSTPSHLSSNNWYQSGSLLTYLKQGTNANQRIGRKVTLKSIKVQGVVQSCEDIQTDMVVCVWLILDKQANGTIFTAADVFGHPGATADDGQIPVSQVQDGPLIITTNYLIANTQRFTVLGKKYVTLRNQIPYTTNLDGQKGGAQGMFTFYKKVNMQIEYGGPTGAIGEIKSNNIQLIIAGTGDMNLAFNTDNAPNYVCYGNTMLRYTDQ